MRIDFLSQFHQSTALAVYKLPSSRCYVILSTAISSSHWHLLQLISWCLPLSFWALEAATFIKSSSIAAQCALPPQKRDFTSSTLSFATEWKWTPRWHLAWKWASKGHPVFFAFHKNLHSTNPTMRFVNSGSGFIEGDQNGLSSLVIQLADR